MVVRLEKVAVGVLHHLITPTVQRRPRKITTALIRVLFVIFSFVLITTINCSDKWRLAGILCIKLSHVSTISTYLVKPG